ASHRRYRSGLAAPNDRVFEGDKAVAARIERLHPWRRAHFGKRTDARSGIRPVWPVTDRPTEWRASLFVSGFRLILRTAKKRWPSERIQSRYTIPSDPDTTSLERSMQHARSSLENGFRTKWPSTSKRWIITPQRVPQGDFDN